MDAAAQLPAAADVTPPQTNTAPPPLPATNTISVPESVPAHKLPVPPDVPAKVVTTEASKPEPPPTPEKSVQQTLPKPSKTPDARVDDLVNSAEVGESKLNLKLIIGVLLGFGLLAGGGYWFVAKERTVASLSDVTPMQPPAVQAPPDLVQQAPTINVQKPEPETTPAVIGVPVPTLSDMPPESTPTSLPVSTESVATAPSTANAVVVSPRTDSTSKKTAKTNKITTDTTAREDVKGLPMQPAVREPPTRTEPPSPRFQPVSQTLDEQFKRRLAAECEQGFAGLFCREKLRFSICDGRWSENPAPGQSVCKGASTNKSAN